jgi:hypothetical protein
MNRIFLAGSLFALLLAADVSAQSPAAPSDRNENVVLKTQAGSLTDFENLARAEERAEILHTRMLRVQVQEMSLQASIEELDFRLTPEGIRIALALVGSAKPMDEWRYALRVSLENQKAAVNRLLDLVVSNRERLETSIREADAEVERLRQRLSTQ